MPLHEAGEYLDAWSELTDPGGPKKYLVLGKGKSKKR
jgi:hypothetical protein